jgi:hypothetical protein
LTLNQYTMCLMSRLAKCSEFAKIGACAFPKSLFVERCEHPLDSGGG